MGHGKKAIGTLDISSEGRVEVTPDIAAVRLSVVTDGKTAEEAASANAAKANEVVEKIVGLGLERDALKTTGLSLYPLYETEPSTGVTRLAGYRAQDSITALSPVKLAGKVFDVGVAAGAGESSGITFELTDERPYREQALDLAIKAARAEADAVCRAMDVELSGPRSIHVTQGSGPVQVRADRLMKSETPVLPGTLSISASVQVVFRISIVSGAWHREPRARSICTDSRQPPCWRACARAPRGSPTKRPEGGARSTARTPWSGRAATRCRCASRARSRTSSP
jgi:hypothetical protein